jgi:hypothetical protein
MQVENNYDRDVYNGNIGVVKALDAEEEELVVDFDGREVAYPYGELDKLVLCYATTIHKSQGSEYAAVVMLLSIQHYLMLERRLVYTGITRGKRLVVLVGLIVRQPAPGHRPCHECTRLRRARGRQRRQTLFEPREREGHAPTMATFEWVTLLLLGAPYPTFLAVGGVLLAGRRHRVLSASAAAQNPSSASLDTWNALGNGLALAAALSAMCSSRPVPTITQAMVRPQSAAGIGTRID